MKRLTRIFSIALLAAFTTSLNVTATPVKPVVKTRPVQLNNYTGVSISGPIKAYITLGDKEHFRLEGDKEAIAELITEVKNGVLIIRPKNKWTEWRRKNRNAEISAYITAKEIKSLSISGSGSIEMKDLVKSGNLAIAVSGSGDIKVPADVKEIAVAISGSGNIKIDGKASKMSSSVDGSGNINARNLTVADLAAQISGSGNIYVNVTRSISAAISGSGNINYGGDPTIAKSVSGSGAVRKM